MIKETQEMYYLGYLNPFFILISYGSSHEKITHISVLFSLIYYLEPNGGMGGTGSVWKRRLITTSSISPRKSTGN